MLDLKITGGTVVDGTGKPGVKGDIGIRDGRIVSIGAVTEEATKTIDASGKIVAPGFVDVHTHYDAQLFWDKTLSPSPLHGITSVIGGNCGFSIAPLKPSEGDYLSRMLARVEGMPLESLQKGVPWDWQSFGEFLDRADGLAVNAGFLVGHCALRRCVMGDRADQEASPEELEQMKTLLGESLKEGGLGFSSTLSHTHTDGDGNPVPSCCATHEEIIALSAKVGEYEGTFLEFIAVVGPFAEEHKELMVEMSAQSGRMLNWNVLSVSKRSQPMYESQLETSDRGAKRGANVLALTVPQVMSMRLNLRGGFLFDSFPGWGEFILKPELLLKDDSLVRVDLEKKVNHLKMDKDAMRDADTLNGGAGNDWIDGGTEDDAISGWTGDDVLYGRSGNDILVGGEGHDTLYGAAGNDILQGDDGKTETDHTRDDDRLDGGTDGDTVRGGGGSDTMLDDASEVDESFAYWAEWVDAV